jgi:Lon protease-like protein
MTELDLPLFPLQSVLFPDGILSLRIFEVRYLDMIARCHKERLPFGVVCLSRGGEVRQPPGTAAVTVAGGDASPREAFHPVGTLAHIVELERPQPGLMMIRCTGGQRFRLQSSHQLKHGLWVGHAELLPADSRVPVPADLAPARLALERLLAHMQATMSQIDALPLQPPYRWDDCGWLANRWCEILPVSPQLKQQFMVLDSPLVRLELVADLLERLKIGAPPASP